MIKEIQILILPWTPNRLCYWKLINYPLHPLHFFLVRRIITERLLTAPSKTRALLHLSSNDLMQAGKKRKRFFTRNLVVYNLSYRYRWYLAVWRVRYVLTQAEARAWSLSPSRLHHAKPYNHSPTIRWIQGDHPTIATPKIGRWLTRKIVFDFTFFAITRPCYLLQLNNNHQIN